MEAPAPVFEMEYVHGRRAHRHRCQYCRRIVNEGERVLMAKLSKKSVVVHVEPCAERESINGWTFRDSLTAWGTAHLQACGWKVPSHPMSISGAKAA